MLSSATKLTAVIGNPIGHSLSPLLHNDIYVREDVDAVMLAFACEIPPETRFPLAGSGVGGLFSAPLAAAYEYDMILLLSVSFSHSGGGRCPSICGRFRISPKGPKVSSRTAARNAGSWRKRL